MLKKILVFDKGGRKERMELIKKNQEIIQQINEAKKSQVNNNQVSAQEGSSGIVPFAKAVSSSPMGITMVPTIYSWKFITEKLYKQ